MIFQILNREQKFGITSVEAQNPDSLMQAHLAV